LARERICAPSVSCEGRESHSGLPEVYGGGEGSGAAAGISRWWVDTEFRGLVPGFAFGGSREKIDHDCRILGSGDFVAEIIREAEKKVRRYLRPGEINHAIDKTIKEICIKEGIGEKEIRLGVRTRKFSRARAKIAYHLSHEFGVSRAEIARQMGVCTSAIAKAIQNIEGTDNKC
jgi:hypothetical protein